MTLTRRRFLIHAGTMAAAVGACGRVRMPETYDLCIIGSGFAGTYLGLRAVENRLHTILIEAGSSPQPLPDEHSLKESFGFSNSGATRYPVNGIRDIAVGGTSTHWGGVMVRLWPSDFRMRSEFGLYVDWPLTFEDLEPYYCQAEKLLSVKGHDPASIAEPARQCRYPVENPEPYRAPELEIEGVQAAFSSVPHSRRNGDFALRLFDEEIPAFMASEYGTLVEDRQVCRIVTLDGRSIDHVEIRGLDGSVDQVRARCFVIAAGTIESARLLLSSTSSWFPTGLGNANDLVGRFFNVHPSIQTRFDVRQDLGLPPGQHRTCSLNDSHRRAGVNASHYQMDVAGNGRVRWRVQPEIEPRHENRVTLNSRQKDAFDNPLPDIGFGYSPRDLLTLERARESTEWAKRMLAASGSEATKHDRWRAHPAGTCRMASNPESGVVDQWNRVYGLENLYVSGAATFPTSGTANPTETLVALTLRLADHLEGLLS
ncbi:MAG: GMC family oxidoreductase [Acidobacteriota bacterium]|nr:GMC family oxidoreductase [Acidobacteriota bacterium]